MATFHYWNLSGQPVILSFPVPWAGLDARLEPGQKLTFNDTSDHRMQVRSAVSGEVIRT